MRKLKKYIHKMATLAILTSSLTFTPSINELPIIVSVAHAEIKTYIGTDTAMFDFGEDDENIVNTVKLCARTRAEQAAREKAGLYIKSDSRLVNSVLTKDEISTITNNILEVVKVEYKKLPYKAYDIQDKSLGKIGLMYEATVTVKIDTSSIEKYLNCDEKERSRLITLNKGINNIINDNNKRFEELNKRSESASSKQERNAIKADLAKIDRDALYVQKLREAENAKSNADRRRLYSEAISINPNRAEAYVARGYSNNGESALNDFKKAVSVDPNYAPAYFWLGSHYSFDKNYDTSIKYFQKAIELDPDYSEAYFQLAIVYRDIKNFQAAITNFSKVIELKSSSHGSLAYAIMGDIYGDNLKEYNKAIEAHTKGIQFAIKYPSNAPEVRLIKPIAWNYSSLGRCYFELKDYNKIYALTARKQSFANVNVIWRCKRLLL